MKCRTKSILPAIVTAISSLLLMTCKQGTGITATEFVVKVDSIAHVSFAASNDTVRIQFYGTIGPDGCYSFSRFETVTRPRALDVTVWGRHQLADICPTVMVYLHGEEYRFVPGETGWFTISIQQPDATMLRDSIIVK